MKASAASALKRLLEARAANPGEPCALLLGDQPARDALVRSLGGGGGDRRSPSADSVVSLDCPLRGEILEGAGVLVELPDSLHTPEEATEVATFLLGLRDADCVLIACSGVGAAYERRDSTALGGVVPIPPADTLPLLAQFYGGELPVLVAVATAGAAPDRADGEAGAIAHTQSAAWRLQLGGAVAHPEFLGYFAANGDPNGADLLGNLRRRCTGAQPHACEPLRGTSPLLSQYRAIRQRLDHLRPEPPPGHPRAGACRDVGPCSSMRSSVSSAPAAPPSPSSNNGLQLPHKTQWTVMVFGKTGAGKSHLANLLCGYRAFESADSVASVTGAESVRKAVSKDRSVMVLDTIGFGDTRLPMDVVARSLRDTALEAPGGIDALVFVLKKERVTTAEQETLAYVTEDLFGPACLPNLYMVVTHAGKLAKDVDAREPWLKEQAAASAPFRAMLQTLGTSPIERIVFVENSDPDDAEDDEDRNLAERRRVRALVDIQNLLARHRAPSYQHDIMHRAGELHAGRIDEVRQELRQRIEAEVRDQVEQEIKGLEEQKQQLKEREAEMQQRFEEEWARMRSDLEARARELARGDLEPIAKQIIDTSEKKAKGRKCSVM
mmetsp:Transcript_55458/g.161095  ORF Transcript_55458/g.161095 Transcript_55458/m.161095 type:complete len:609 (-) Transcript_55458:84-1910(-)